MKLLGLFRITLGVSIVCASTEALSNLRSGHAAQLEAHARQGVQHAAFHPHLDSMKTVEMEARAQQNTATKQNAAGPKMMEARAKAMVAIHHGKLYQMMQQVEQQKRAKETVNAPSPSKPTEFKPQANEDAGAQVTDAPTESRPHADENGARVQSTDAPTEKATDAPAEFKSHP